MTVNMCRKHCYSYNFALAGLTKGSTCACGDDDITEIRRNDVTCNSVCAGDEHGICGGSSSISIYDGN